MGKGGQEKSLLLDNVTNPNGGSFDFIHDCDNDNFPRYYWGKQSPKEGKGYAGICVYSSFSKTKEYIQLVFKEPLIKGGIYKFKMYISLADNSMMAINKIGIYFSKELKVKGSENIKVKPHIISYDFYVNYDDWELYQGDYIAEGGETHLSIGNFNLQSVDSTKVIRGGNAELASVYYFINDVFLELNEDLSKSITLNNINFKVNSSELIPSSLNTLDRVILAMKQNTKYKLTIIGHTDSVGDSKRNQTLSYNRAKTVADYISKNGIEKNKIIVKGMGGKQPIADNSIESGRYKNRRVEFKFE
jgi:outer membrane protein OmpA-like peptidoglycan-associated protein